MFVPNDNIYLTIVFYFNDIYFRHCFQKKHFITQISNNKIVW